VLYHCLKIQAVIVLKCILNKILLYNYDIHIKWTHKSRSFKNIKSKTITACMETFYSLGISMQ